MPADAHPFEFMLCGAHPRHACEHPATLPLGPSEPQKVRMPEGYRTSHGGDGLHATALQANAGPREKVRVTTCAASDNTRASLRTALAHSPRTPGHAIKKYENVAPLA